jgi:hypothetical protein
VASGGWAWCDFIHARQLQEWPAGRRDSRQLACTFSNLDKVLYPAVGFTPTPEELQRDFPLYESPAFPGTAAPTAKSPHSPRTLEEKKATTPGVLRDGWAYETMRPRSLFTS